jgi:protein-disulfide isomerase
MSLNRSLLVSVSLIGFASAAFAADAAAPATPSAAPAQAIAAPPPVAAVPAVVPAAAPANNANLVTKQELPGLIKDTLMRDPEMIMDAVKILKDKQAAEAKKKAEDALVKNKDTLLNDENSPVIGDAKTADLTIVEFFDYHCGYCRHLLPDLTKLYKEDGKFRIVFKEFPILSDDSAVAARAALAVNRIAKDKYFDFHTTLMKFDGKYEEKSLLELAKKLGINGDKLKAEMAKPEIAAELDKNRALAEELGIHGTPALIIGDELSPGAMPYDDLKKAVADARSGKKADAIPAPELAPKPAAPAAAAPAAPTAPVINPPTIAAPPAAPAIPAAPTPKKE